jgi:hypothetical protein
VFADVDLAPHEVEVDFAHRGLAPAEGRGTVGLWCALHGEAFCDAGLHHIARQGDFDRMREHLARDGVECMAPFAALPYLHQCFTTGQRWAVPESRVVALRFEGALSSEEAARIAADGAIGSHFELIERGQGYRGFLQQGISDIISRTDPRRSEPRLRPSAND